MVDELVKTVMSEMRQMAKSQNVVAEPIKLGENTVVVPVSKIALGFGAGGVGGNGEGSGGSGTGGGISIEPVAFIVVSEGKPTLLPLAKTEATLSKVIDLVPEVLSKIGNLGLMRGNKKEEAEPQAVEEDTEE